jgi:hypothetical protein
VQSEEAEDNWYKYVTASCIVRKTASFLYENEIGDEDAQDAELLVSSRLWGFYCRAAWTEALRKSADLLLNDDAKACCIPGHIPDRGGWIFHSK